MRRAILVAVALCCFVVCGEARAPAFAEAPLAAETVCVKYGPCPLDISRFTCTDTPRSSFIRRVLLLPASACRGEASTPRHEAVQTGGAQRLQAHQ